MKKIVNFLLKCWIVQLVQLDMALLVHLKTVRDLRGKGDRIAKVTFRGNKLKYFIITTDDLSGMFSLSMTQ